VPAGTASPTKYTVDRDAVGDREADLAEVRKLWEARGMDTRRYKSRGCHPDHGDQR
jgi:hypothetical protein